MHKRGVTEKPHNFKKAWKNILKYSKRYYLLIVIALIASVVATFLALVAPTELSRLANEISNVISENNIEMENILLIGINILFLYFLNYVFSATAAISMVQINQNIGKNLRRDIFEKINKMLMEKIKKESIGDVISRIANDVDTLCGAINNSITSLVSSVVLLVGCVVMMFITNAMLASVAIAASLIGFVFITIIAKKSQKYFSKQQKEIGKINGYIEEAFTGQEQIAAYCQEENNINKFDELNAELYKSSFNAQSLSGLMQPMMTFMGNLGYISVWLFGGLLAFNNVITFGTVIAFIIYIEYFSEPLTKISKAIQTLQSAAAAGERIFEFLDNEEVSDESQKQRLLSNVKGNVEFKNVKFGYTPDNIVIENFSLSVAAGEKIAIVGHTGSGKTTLVNLLMRFYDIQEGDILIDGVSILDMSREEVHDSFSMVLQDSWVFEGTIKDNLKYCKDDVSDEMIINACKSVGIHHFIKTLPNGYNTVLNEKTSLSQGQKQQLTIARAIIANKNMTILDEATSSVDTRTERKIQKSMDMLTKGKTSFVVAHRLSTIQNADKIVVLDKGKIVETGTHEQLIQNGKYYKELYSSQFDTIDTEY